MELQVWSVGQEWHFFLCADVRAHKMHAQSGLGGLSSPWLGLGRLAWIGYPMATKLCVGRDPVVRST